jgi:hypothetical protein
VGSDGVVSNGKNRALQIGRLACSKHIAQGK